jgi:DNA-binding transcriptional ArsR family regulator
MPNCLCLLLLVLGQYNDRMTEAANLVEVAALVGDTARATMLAALMGGEALTATELAHGANISRSTASEHLGKLVAARLLVVTRRRRFCYYRLASPLIAGMLESMKLVAAIEVPARHRARSARDDAVRFARSCYDHLAGWAGVAVADAPSLRGRIMSDERPVLGLDSRDLLEIAPAGGVWRPEEVRESFYFSND